MFYKSCRPVLGSNRVTPKWKPFGISCPQLKTQNNKSVHNVKCWLLESANYPSHKQPQQEIVCSASRALHACQCLRGLNGVRRQRRKGDRTTRQESREESKFSLMHACYRGRSQRRRVLRLRRGGRARWVLAGTLRHTSSSFLFIVTLLLISIPNFIV